MMAFQRSPLEIKTAIVIEVVDTDVAAQKLLEEGFTPIECSFGEKSIVDSLNLDHHGALSNLEGVAIRAYRDHFGACKKSPRFVVTGYPDEDATFAIAALVGIIPHPELAKSFPDMPANLKTLVARDLSPVAELINDVDLHPDQALKLVDTTIGRILLTWRQQGHRRCQDALAWLGGVDRWRTLLVDQEEELINASVKSQDSHLDSVSKARKKTISKDIVVVNLSKFGPNSSDYQIWLEKFPVIIAFRGGVDGRGFCSFVVRNLETAKELFGERGLQEVYPLLKPGRCGGREIIGGSSRTVPVSWDQAKDFGKQLKTLIQARRMPKKSS
jgi:hypothetical protein